MGNVCLLCAFIFVVFGIVGVQLFGGLLDYQCFDEADVSGTPPVPNEDAEPTDVCKFDHNVQGAQGSCDEGQHCLKTTPPNNGLTHMDHIGGAFLIVFQCITGTPRTKPFVHRLTEPRFLLQFSCFVCAFV